MTRRKHPKPGVVVPEELPFLTKQEAASLARVRDRTLDKWIAAGLLKAYKIAGQSVRIKRADILALIVETPPLTPRKSKVVA